MTWKEMRMGHIWEELHGGHGHQASHYQVDSEQVPSRAALHLDQPSSTLAMDLTPCIPNL